MNHIIAYLRRRIIHRIGLPGAVLLTLSGSPAMAQTIPSDAKATCVVAPSLFNTWFQTGSVTVNGVVKPANSVSFPNVPNCDFYQWAQQMFLWLTSPAPATYGGGGGRIFNSPVFYDVSPADPTTGARTFIPHVAGRITILGLRAAQVGANGFPVLFSADGHLLQLRPTQTAPDGRPLILNSKGALIEFQRATISPNNRVIFFDKAGKTIQLGAVARAPVLHAAAPKLLSPSGIVLNRIQPNSSLIVQKIIINGRPIFIDPQGNVVQTEPDEADDGVVESQGGSLVYYITMANDVYAYFATGLAHGAVSTGGQFPTTQAQLNQITAFATAHGKTFPDPDALAVEVKSSWVEASTLTNPSSYITITATIPTYNKTNPKLWVPNGQKTTLLALVGIHVVGSTAGHPEMIWSTFEHFGNAPMATYTYNSASGPKTVQQNTAGTWLFASNGATSGFNVPKMQVNPPSPDIAAISPNTISPSNVLRAKAWGAAQNVSPNPIDGSTAASNTEIIAIDHAILSMLSGTDVRSNYFMTGATWTIGGAAPNGSNQVGTSELGNSTMETFQLGTDNTTTSGASNCFSCHLGNNTGVSHVFAALELKPLF